MAEAVLAAPARPIAVSFDAPARSQWWDALTRLRRDRVAMIGAVLIAFILLLAILAPYISPYDYAAINGQRKLIGPGSVYLLGGDELGRDLLSRVLWGARASLPIAFSAMIGGTVVGTAVGLVCGFYKGWLDQVVMRFMDILLAFPGLVLALALLAILGPDIKNLILALVISSIPGHARLARGMALSVGAQPYVESAKTAGAKDWRIMMRYILPNSMAPILISASASLGGLILAEAGLSFLGLGIQPPTPSWGMMLNTGRTYLTASPWLMVWPGLAIFMAVIGFNLLGDGIRDAMDPRLRR
ncbi:MAG: ABC transporter permease [Chloroflexi bacterium]|nr:ABC transporter permease [Chloroflexota bacterium]